MSRSIRDLRELICLSRFGFRPDEISNESVTPADEVKPCLLFYFDPSILDNWLELTSVRMEKLRSLSNITLIEFIHFWLKQFDHQHKVSLFQMEFELFVEHLTLAFTPNDTNAEQINRFAQQILHDIDYQRTSSPSIDNDRKFILIIDIFNRRKRDDEYRNLLANLSTELTNQTTDHLHLQWMLAIRAFALVALCTAAVEFFEKIQKSLEQSRKRGEPMSPRVEHRSTSDQISDQIKDRLIITLRKDYVDVLDYLIETNQVPGDALDDQNRNILFHALPLENLNIIEHLLQAVQKLTNLDVNAIAKSGSSLPHLCVTLQRVDILQLLIKYAPTINLNQRNQQDATPLHLSIIYDDVNMARFLLQSGADRTMTMKSKTCLQLANEFQNPTMIELFSSSS